MLVLALSTSTEKGSVCLAHSQKGILSEQIWDKQLQHGELIVSYVDQVLLDSDLKPESIDLIAVDKGPGSFTGARVAVNVARTLSYSLDIPIFGLSSLEILASQIENEGHPICSIIDAHKNLFFTAIFQNKTLKTSLSARSSEEIGALVKQETLFVGPLTKDQYDEIKKVVGKFFVRPGGANLDYPLASTLAKLSFEKKISEIDGNWTNIEPLYVRPPEAQEKLAAGQLPKYDKRRQKS